MKKTLLLLFSLIIGQVCFAYETVIVAFPEKEGWQSVYHESQGTETILQYVPRGQSYNSWTRTVIFHSYKNPRPSNNAAVFLDVTTSQMENSNATQLYKYLKYTDTDSIATRCISSNARIKQQCEIYRVSQSYEGVITMHYINKNIQDFKNTYDKWYQIIKNIRIYYSYWRNDRVMNKATIFEL